MTSRLRSRWLEKTVPAGAELAFIRAVLGLLGAGGVVLAGYVTFKGRDGTATAALIGACVILLFLAAFGHLIKSFKYGEVEMLLRQARAADDLGDDEAREAFVGAALSAAGISKGLADDIDVASESWLHRNAVLNALDRLVGRDVKILYINRPVRGLAIANDVTVGVHMRSGVKKVDALRERLIKKGMRAEGRHLDGLLLVVRKDPTDSALEPAQIRLEAGLGFPVRVIGWQRDDPPEPLSEALEDLLAAVRATRS